MSTNGNEFVKSATTSTAVAKSQGDIMAMLGRYGASGFGFRKRGTVVSVTFHLPNIAGNPDLPDTSIEIPVDIAAVSARIKTSKAATAKLAQNKKGAGETQAERVAWRVLYLWIDAALAAVSIGAQTVQDAFLAHLIIETTDGQRGRLADYFAAVVAGDARQRLPELHGGRRMIGAGEHNAH